MLNNSIYKGKASWLRDTDRPGLDKCTGCGVCSLPCPVWHQTHDIMLTLRGRALALQGGSSPEDLRQSIMACVLCGACEPACPVGIDTVGMTLDLRSILRMRERSPLADSVLTNRPPQAHGQSTTRRSSTLFLPDPALQSDDIRFKKILQLLESKGKALSIFNHGSYLAAAIEAGLELSQDQRAGFVLSLAGAEELVVTEGLLHRHLRRWLPQVRVIGLGEALLHLNPIRKALLPTDLYVIETRGFHADYARLIQFYDRMSRETGCYLNVDLQRIAIPTGAAGLQDRLGTNLLDPAKQVHLIMDGRTIDRIVVESIEDLEPFRQETGLKVIHVSELMVEG